MKLLLFVLLLVHLSLQQQILPEFYRSIVVEFSPVTALDMPVPDKNAAVRVMETNVQRIDNLLEQYFSNSSKQVDIIVLPEYGLNGAYFKNKEVVLNFAEYIPSSLVNPCSNSSMKVSNPILSALSCLAQKFSTYLVADMADVQPGSLVYNTQVAFDRTGKLISKYHKSHLYYEPFFTQGNPEDVAYFETDFGVRFGMFICFDMMFTNPAQVLLQKLNVRDFAYSTWWVNFPPMINAIQMQQAWSEYHKVNLLASNSGYNWRISGSGIYSQGKPLSSTYRYSPKNNQVLEAMVPILSLKDQHRTQPPLQPNNSTVELQYDTFVAVPNLSNIIEKSTSKIHCRVQFQVSSSSNSTTQEMYAVYATSGYIFPVLEAEVCGILKCGATIEDCAAVFRFQKFVLQSSTIFDFVSIEATKLQQEDPTPLYSMSSQDSMQLIPWSLQTIQHSSQKSSLTISHTTNVLSSSLFGVIGG